MNTLKRVHVTIGQDSYAKHLSVNNIMFVSQLMISGITIGLHIDQLVTSMLALADSNIMMQLCSHNWEVKNLQRYT
jgi:hypothetical protein